MRTLPALCFLRRFYQLAALALVLSTTFSQVYNPNATGYVNTSLRPGFSLISNPLSAQDNRIAALFAGTIQQPVPDNFTVFVMENGQYVAATFSLATGKFEPEEVANREVRPGEGVFVYNPGPADLILTFVGEVLHGVITNRVPAGFSIVSSSVPASRTLDELLFPKTPGDIIYLFDSATQQYQVSVFDDIENRWLPPPRKLNVGEAFVVRKKGSAEWIQTNAITGFAGEAITARSGASSDETFSWSETFAPLPMRAGDQVLLSMELIPAGQSMEIAAIAPSGETFFTLEFRDGLINNAVPYRTNSWNRLQVRADLDAQMYDLFLEGSGIAAGSFPLGPGATLLVPSINELQVRTTGFPGVTATAWIDNITLTQQGTVLSNPLNLLVIDFDQTLPRSAAETGTLRKEIRP